MKLQNEWWGYSNDYGWAVIEEIDYEKYDGGEAIFYSFTKQCHFSLPFRDLSDRDIVFALRYLKELSEIERTEQKKIYLKHRASWPVIQQGFIETKRLELLAEQEQAAIDRRKKEELLLAAKLEQVRLSELADARRAAQLAADLLAKKEVRARRLNAFKQKMLINQEATIESIKTVLAVHRITQLIHFTRIENLPTILSHGIVPKNELPFDAICNDEIRLDGFPEASCLTISFPNWKMLYTYCRKDQSHNWAILLIDPSVLFDLPCLFFSTNAANGRFRTLHFEQLEHLMGFDGLTSMFTDEPIGVRERGMLRVNWPTDAQAEILCFERIPSNRIYGIEVLKSDIRIESLVRNNYSNIAYGKQRGLFSPRGDWEFWRSNLSY